MNDLIKVSYTGEQPTVSGRELHEALGIKTPYTQWFERMIEYGFSENEDYILVSQKCETNNPKNPYTTIIDHELKARALGISSRHTRNKLLLFQLYLWCFRYRHRELLPLLRR